MCITHVLFCFFFSVPGSCVDGWAEVTGKYRIDGRVPGFGEHDLDHFTLTLGGYNVSEIWVNLHVY